MLMRLIDAQFLETPYDGSRQMRWYLRRLGHEVGRKRVRRLMAMMALRADLPRSRARVRPIRSIGNIRICCGIWSSTGPTRSGVPTSRIFPRGGAFSTSWRSWTGRRAGRCRGAWRARWMRNSRLAQAGIGGTNQLLQQASHRGQINIRRASGYGMITKIKSVIHKGVKKFIPNCARCRP